MPTIGIRELKANPSSVLKRVRLKRETVAVTFRGEVVARIVPVQPNVAAGNESGWVELDELVAKIGKQLKKRTSKKAAVDSSDLRREL